MEMAGEPGRVGNVEVVALGILGLSDGGVRCEVVERDVFAGEVGAQLSEVGGHLGGVRGITAADGPAFDANHEKVEPFLASEGDDVGEEGFGGVTGEGGFLQAGMVACLDADVLAEAGKAEAVIGKGSGGGGILAGQPGGGVLQAIGGGLTLGLEGESGVVDEAVEAASVTAAMVAEDAADHGVGHFGHAAFEVMPEGTIHLVGGKMPESVAEQENDASRADLGADHVVFEHEVPAGAGAVGLPEGGDAALGELAEGGGINPGADHGVAEEDDFWALLLEFFQRGAGEEGLAAGEPVILGFGGDGVRLRGRGAAPEGWGKDDSGQVGGQVLQVLTTCRVQARKTPRVGRCGLKSMDDGSAPGSKKRCMCD